MSQICLIQAKKTENQSHSLKFGEDLVNITTYTILIIINNDLVDVSYL